MYEQISMFDIKETVDYWIDKILDLNHKGFENEKIDVNDKLDFFRIKITVDQAMRFEHYKKWCLDKNENNYMCESHYIQFYFKGHFKGECIVSALGLSSCSMWLNNHDKGSINLIEGLKKVYEVLND